MNLWIQEENYSKTLNFGAPASPQWSTKYSSLKHVLQTHHYSQGFFFFPGKRQFLYINLHPLFRVPDLLKGKKKLQMTIKKWRGKKRGGKNAFLTRLYFYAKIKLLIGFSGRAERLWDLRTHTLFSSRFYWLHQFSLWSGHLADIL